ncbi:hypothetical protein KIN20_024540 [Parelaphostrongylus tenuis]|uniref:Uncharacterized protein n=1 Tax=Parelaphostrongylus tenuis TaxID=148309 RepID=A0AAD5MTL9_PARTN|nr:hypothetical protein KIN20_024540 [Parelaphostrongylus tenuis]
MKYFTTIAIVTENITVLVGFNIAQADTYGEFPVFIRIGSYRCRAEKLRSLTAAAVIAVSKLKDISFVLDWISISSLESVRENHIHGVLLLISFILETSICDQVKGRVRGILVKLSQSKLWLKWCDMNKNIFLQLCNTVCLNFLDFTTAIDTSELVLTKRPLAKALLLRDTDEAHLFSDLELRLEFYRHVQVFGRSIKNFKSVLNFVINDLHNCVNERDASCILDVIYFNKDLFSATDFAAVTECILLRLEKQWRMPITISKARRLLAFISDEITTSDDELRWLKSCISVEEEVCKRIALQVGAHHLKYGIDNRLLVHMHAFLQDDDVRIREEASSILSPIVSKVNIVLNPTVCYWLITDLMPSSKEETTEHEEVSISKEVLYDVCSSSPYAESGYFGDYTDVKVMVNAL